MIAMLNGTMIDSRFIGAFLVSNSPDQGDRVACRQFDDVGNIRAGAIRLC
jgi:hypothetical protein